MVRNRSGRNVALADLGQVPASAAEAVWAVAEHFRSGQIDVAAIDAIEAETRHDVIAFLTYLAEQVGPESRFVHRGMTSSDVLDTAFSMQLRDASDLLLEALSALLAVLGAVLLNIRKHYRSGVVMESTPSQRPLGETGRALRHFPAVPAAAGSSTRRSCVLRAFWRGRDFR